MNEQINKTRDHIFEGEWRGRYGSVQKQEREERKVVIQKNIKNKRKGSSKNFQQLYNF